MIIKNKHISIYYYHILDSKSEFWEWKLYIEKCIRDILYLWTKNFSLLNNIIKNKIMLKNLTEIKSINSIPF